MQLLLSTRHSARCGDSSASRKRRSSNHWHQQSTEEGLVDPIIIQTMRTLWSALPERTWCIRGALTSVRRAGKAWQLGTWQLHWHRHDVERFSVQRDDSRRRPCNTRGHGPCRARKQDRVARLAEGAGKPWQRQGWRGRRGEVLRYEALLGTVPLS